MKSSLFNQNQFTTHDSIDEKVDLHQLHVHSCNILLNMIEFNNLHWVFTIANDWWIETNESDSSFSFVSLSTKGTASHNQLCGFNQWIKYFDFLKSDQFSKNEHVDNNVSLLVDWVEIKTDN